IPTPADTFIRVKELLRSSRKVVVISGAGISANAGFPTFQQIRKSKQTSFDRSLYSSSVEATQFHSTVCSMFAHTKSDSCQPTPFHKTMATLAHEHRLLLHITQNIDCVEQRLPDLDAKTIRLHGRVDQMRCQKNQARASQGKRILSLGRLRPDVLLYGEPHPDDTGILQTIQSGLETGPDLVLVVGTTLKVPGSLSIATNFCRATQSRGGVAVWISKEAPLLRVRHLFDYVFRGDCDDLA
ncbi:DHS-like NAD/FAD-binding domain-containing protein, partial [Leptodontidium sp. MPI-SDFR-AT-0119]